MTANERVGWLNERDPLHQWRVGQEVYCLHCEAVFQAQDVGEDAQGYPECPLCQATPLDFHPEPFWREDLIEEREIRGVWVFAWKAEPIRAVAGQPQHLPPAKG